jgi:hypothetical protein
MTSIATRSSIDGATKSISPPDPIGAELWKRRTSRKHSRFRCRCLPFPYAAEPSKKRPPETTVLRTQTLHEPLALCK